MKRWILILLLCAMGSTALAAAGNFPELFVPAENDLSIWYLGNIFGSDLLGNLVQGNMANQISGNRLMSVLFGIFNQVALVVGIIIIVYTIIAGTLNTAHEGKPLGEKWNSLWMPVRSSIGIAMLVPSGGSGYCLAQTLVMWLTLQGIGAGDQVWNAMVDYFAQGGAIYSQNASQSGAYMTTPNVNYTLNLMGQTPRQDVTGTDGKIIDQKSPTSSDNGTLSLLNPMICMEIFNNDKEALELNNNHRYSAYTMPQDTTTVYFGDQNAMLALASQSKDPLPYVPKSTVGMECGAIAVTVGMDNCTTPSNNPPGKCGEPEQRETIYTTANWNAAHGLQTLAKEIATNPESQDNWDNYTSAVYNNSQLYINYLVGYEDFLHNPHSITTKQSSKAFDMYKKYGWILAGNYYTILSGFKEKVDNLTRKMIPPATVTWYNVQGVGYALPKSGEPYDTAYRNAATFWGGLPKSTETIQKYIPDYQKSAGSGASKTTATGLNSLGTNTNRIGPVNMKEIMETLGKPVMNPGKRLSQKDKRGTGTSRTGQASMATQSAVQNYIHYLTGVGSNPRDMTVAQDPILRASSYGKGLTSSALVIMISAGLIWIAAAASHVCDAQLPVGTVFTAVAEPIVAGLVMLAVFMYTQGAILGVFIPLIPYVTFFIGVVGWLLQVVEAVAAAPLVAIGLIFPETRDEIWGRAAPAYMMILALFLRPPLMLVGFAAAMIVLWCLTQLLNIGFLTLTAVTFRIEDMFGFVVIMTAYTAIFTVVVTRSYELINVVPNKVLNWIGGPGFEVAGAETAIGKAQEGVGTGAGAVASGMKAGAGDSLSHGAQKGREEYDKAGTAASAEASAAAKSGGKARSREDILRGKPKD